MNQHGLTEPCETSSFLLATLGFALSFHSARFPHPPLLLCLDMQLPLLIAFLNAACILGYDVASESHVQLIN
jgi:hypothetical protein